jgi:HlyD family secretion protein
MERTTKRRILTWGGLAVIAVALIALALKPRPVPADLVEVVRGPMEVTLEHEGTARVRDRFVVSAPVPGRVHRITLEPGDPVDAGVTVLATFEPSDPVLLDSRSRAEAEATVKAARSALERARADRERALAEHRLAVTELDRIRRLNEEGILSAERLDSAQTEAKARAEALQAAEAAVRTAAHELEVAEARLVMPGDASTGAKPVIRLHSPIHGVVLRRYRESEAVVPAGEPLVEVADPADLEIVADFLSTDAVRIRPGMPVRIEQWGGGELDGSVRRVEPYGFMKVSALGVEEQRVNVVADFTGPREERESLGDGYRVEMRVVVWAKEEVLQVPTSALFRHQEEWAVFAVSGGRARLALVEIGQRNGLAAELLSGLVEGDEVIAHPAEEVADGVRVARRES